MWEIGWRRGVVARAENAETENAQLRLQIDSLEDSCRLLREALKELSDEFTEQNGVFYVDVIWRDYPTQSEHAAHKWGQLYPDTVALIRAARAALKEKETHDALSLYM